MNRLTDIQQILNHLELVYKHPGNVSRKFEKDSLSRTRDITDNLILVRKLGNEQTDRHTKIWIYLDLQYKHPRNFSRKFEKDSLSRTWDILNTLIWVRKWGPEQTDRQRRYLKLFETIVETSPECLKKIWER